MLELISKINSSVNNFIWGVPAMICIIGVGIILTAKTRFIQVRKFGVAMKNTIGKIFEKKDAADGSMTPFQAVCTALAGTVGTGNIAGVAGAIAIGGPGAVFWMWCSAFLGMCTKYAEVLLAVHFREKNADGEYIGGPMYYIKNGLSKKWRFLAYAFAIFGILTVFGTGNATQVNTIVSAVNAALIDLNLVSDAGSTVLNLIIGISCAALVAMVLLGGVKRIGSVTEKLVPFMALLYIILSLGVVFVNIKSVPLVFTSIFAGAFSPRSFTGGIVGSMFLSLKKGVSRGIFSNEAGLGTGSIAHACSDTNDPVKQGLFGIFEVFTDTIVICTLTALVILTSGITINYGQAAGADLTISGFTSTYGRWISIFTAASLCCFAFSTIIGWGLYGSRCVEFVFKSKAVRPFLVIYSFISVVGATMDLGLMWDIADTFNGLMAIPNLIALFLLSGTVVKLTKERFDKKREGNNLSFDIPDYKKVRVIIDTDAACEADDPFAISHALMCRKLIVKGITAEHFVEEGSVQKSLAEVNTILDAMNVTDVKSYIGQTKPFSEYDKEELSPASKFIIEEANREDEHPLFVLCIGATTNLAYALKADPSIAKKMTVISIIGHNYSDPLPWREFNAYNDIDAINFILKSDVEFWQVPSDVYGSMLVSLAELESKVLPYGKIGHHLFTQMVEYNMSDKAAWTQGESWALGDSPAVGIAMYPRCGKYVEREAQLFNHDELTSYGKKIPGRKIRVYESVDSHFILEDFFAKLKINFES